MKTITQIQQAVDMQFTQAVNQRRNLDKDIDDIRRKLEIKANECNKLQDQLNYMHSTTDQYKDKLAREKEILKDEHAGDIQRLKAEHDSARNESNDMLQQLIQQVKKQKAELEQRNLSKQSSELTLTEEIRRLQQENARLMVIVCSFVVLNLVSIISYDYVINNSNRRTLARKTPIVLSMK